MVCKTCNHDLVVHDSGWCYAVECETRGRPCENIQPKSTMREFETGATRDSDDTKLDYEGFLSPLVLKRFAEYMHTHRIQRDGKLRDSDNWQKGIPKDAYAKSLMRHLMDFWLIHRNHPEQAVDKDIEVVLCAILFNVQGYLYETLKDKKVGEPLLADAKNREFEWWCDSCQLWHNVNEVPNDSYPNDRY